MSNYLREVNEQYLNYQKKVLYLYAEGNTLEEICISAKNKYSPVYNELEKQKLKNIIKRLRHITDVLCQILKIANEDI